MAFVRVNPLGWALFEELTSAQMNQLDLNASRAIDGTFGGTYNNSGPIIINGQLQAADLLVTGATFDNLTADTLVVNDSTTLNTLTTVNDTLVVNAAGSYNADQRFYDDVFFEGLSTNVIAGLFVVYSSATARFEGEVDFYNTSDVTVRGLWEFTGTSNVTFSASSSTVVNGGWTFLTQPSFTDGLQINAGELVNYATSKSWDVRFNFSISGGGGQVDSSFDFDSGGFWRQVANTGWPRRLWAFPQGLWGDTPVDLIAAEFRVRGNGLSGGTSGNTGFNLFLANEDLAATNSVVIGDPTPNSNVDHSCSWSGIFNYDPAVEHLGVVFLGYDGGDTLNGSSKWYEIKSGRLTFRTDAKGVY